MTKENVVVEAVQELDSVAGNVGIHTELLHDVSTKFMSVVDDMNNAVYKGEQMAYYREHHHELRMLSELLRYCMNDIAQDAEELSALRKTLFNELVREGADA